jgi:2-oxoglutarate ferredoxin oxidoreductase subunit alpha
VVAVSYRGSLLLVGWGSTYGAITKAASVMRADGYSVSNVHLRWIHPLHPELGELMSRFDKVVVAEMNLGQLSRLIRDELLVDAKGLHKVQGKPFKVSEICEAIAKDARRVS